MIATGGARAGHQCAPRRRGASTSYTILTMRLGPVGVWQGGYGRPADDDRELVAEIEELGYGALWFGEAPGGKEAFARAATLLAATSTS